MSFNWHYLKFTLETFLCIFAGVYILMGSPAKEAGGIKNMWEGEKIIKKKSSKNIFSHLGRKNTKKVGGIKKNE